MLRPGTDRKGQGPGAEANTARRLPTIPGVGSLTALAVEAFAPPKESFKCGRDFAAWLGLVPRHLGIDDDERGLPSSGTGRGSMTKMRQNLP